MIEHDTEGLSNSFAKWFAIIAMIVGGCVLTVTITIYLSSNPSAISNPSICVVASTSATLIPAEPNSITVLIKESEEVCYVYRELEEL